MSRSDDYSKDTSKITMTITSSSGTYLSDTLQPQRYYVSLKVKDNEGSTVCDVGLSYEQAARMMLYNGEVPCTLLRYRDKDGTLMEENVEPPTSVHDNMMDRLGDVYTDLLKRIQDVKKDAYEIVQGRSKGKKALEQLLFDLGVIENHYQSNQTYVAERAEEEVAEIQSNAAGQLGVFLESHFGVGAKKDALISLIDSVKSQKRIEGPKTEPIIENYQKKPREEISLEEMTVSDVAIETNMRLKTIESKIKVAEKYSFLSGASACAKKNKVILVYVSYQGSSNLSLEEAKKYLSFLRGLKSADEFKTHRQAI